MSNRRTAADDPSLTILLLISHVRFIIFIVTINGSIVNNQILKK